MQGTKIMVGYFDGASRGNPGDGGAGAILVKDGREVWSTANYLGTKTNNEAEYSAVIALLKEAVSRGVETLHVFGDSKLVVNQLSRKWQISAAHLRVLAQEAWKISEGMEVVYEWIPRERNARADFLSNKAIDQKYRCERG